MAGLEPGAYEIFGTKVRLTEEGSVRNFNTPTLAGSGAKLTQCVDFCRSILSADEEGLKKICRSNAVTMLSL